MPVLTRKSVARTLFSMAVPMLAGTFAMNAYSLTDTWFIAKLGTLPLAAMGFIFPVVMLLTCVARGIGSGVTTLLSHAIGRGDRDDAARLLAIGVLLSIAITAAMSIAGYLFIEPLFKLLGAGPEAMPLIAEYMQIWYLGAVFMTLPMLGNGVLMSVGDSRAASSFIILGTVLNLILDPVMIFGLLGCPAMGIRGAALATILSQALSTLWLLHLLIRKHRLLVWRAFDIGRCLPHLRRIAAFAIPSIISMILMPISASIITRLLSSYGHEVVAAIGAAGRIEMFAFMVPMALGISLTPFVSQNFGAARMDRLKQARTFATAFAFGYGAFTALVFWLAAPYLAAAFTNDPKVAGTLISYIRIVPVGYGLMEVHRYCGFFLTGMQKPVSATMLNALRVLVLLIPLSWIGAHYWRIQGVFTGRLITDIVVGCIGMIWVSRTLRRTAKASSAIPQTADSRPASA